jgi:DNA-binding transcriptional ArsR family regulator
MSQSLISHHLSDLTSAGLIDNIREGKYVKHYLTPKGKILARMLIAMTSKIKGGEIHNGQK